MERPQYKQTMATRWKEPAIGDTVRVRSCTIYFYLPPGLPEQTDCKLLARDSGRYVVEALGQTWNIPVQCVEHEQQRELNGIWLDSMDRRIRKAQAFLDRLHAAERQRKTSWPTR